MKTKELSNQKVGAGFQGIVFVIVFICLSFIFSIRYNRFIIHDPYMPLIANKATNKQVAVGLHVAHFGDFDIAKNKFVLDGTIWFAFNPKDVSLDIIKKFAVFNGVLEGISDPVIIEHDDETIVKFRIKAAFNTPLSYHMFPLDDHRINLVIINRFLPDGVIFSGKDKNITISPSIYLPGWHIVSHAIRTGFKNVTLEQNNKRYSDEQQEVIITLNCERTDPGIMINILLTLLLMLFLAMLTFSSDEDSVLIVTVGIVALIGYRTVMQTMAPPQVSYFILLDYLYLFTLISIMATLFGGIITRERGSSLFVKKCYIVSVYTLFVIACAILSVM